MSVASSTDDTSLTTDSGTVYAAAAVAGVAIKNLIQIREVGNVRMFMCLVNKDTVVVIKGV